MTPSALADRLGASGTFRVEPAGAGRVRRVCQVEVRADVFAVGGLLERSAAQQLRDGLERMATFLNAWLAERVR